MAQFSRLSKLFLVLASLPILSDQNIEEIIITGSLTKKSEQDSNPLQVITQKDYKNFNISNIGEIAKHIPSASGSHFQSNNLDGFDQGMSSFNMRGLGHSSTLILLNSKRHTFAGTPSSDGSSYIDLKSYFLNYYKLMYLLFFWFLYFFDAHLLYLNYIIFSLWSRFLFLIFSSHLDYKYLSL